MNLSYKDGDIFYYVLLNKEINQYYVMAYKYQDKWDNSFDHNLMFKTKEEAEQKANAMNMNLKIKIVNVKIEEEDLKEKKTIIGFDVITNDDYFYSKLKQIQKRCETKEK